jgi:hypothetical protein
MAYTFEAVSKCELKALAKTHPFKVVYTTPDGKPRRRYFESQEAAQAWLEWAIGVVRTELPKGVTIDLRQVKPFYARKNKYGKRAGYYAATVQEAVKWLATK